ncbi:MAG TPA: hypothetical protein VL123_04360 [Candidatus Udaeobacter sp.]|jgi:hypothetical protein|nr:hypothetical protein [Candidatus Udaeobacter sp.]
MRPTAVFCIGFLALACAVHSLPAFAECNERSVYKFIFDERNQPRTWQEVHAAYVRFSGCDDGVVGQWFSDLVVKRLANRWSTFPDLVLIVRKDPAFGPWVVSHVDASSDSLDLAHAVHNARSRSFRRGATLCRRIAAAGEKAVREE